VLIDGPEAPPQPVLIQGDTVIAIVHSVIIDGR
jgi:hypothetical protein